MDAEVAELRRLLDIERSYRLEVEEERDFLLKDNDLLRQQLRLNVPVITKHATTLTGSAETSSVAIALKCDAIDSVVTRVKDASGGKNVICCAFATIPPGDASSASCSDNAPVDIVLCGGVDNAVSAYTLSGELLLKLSVPAPVISMDAVGCTIACGMMDGSHAMFRLAFSGEVMIAAPMEPAHALGDGDTAAEASPVNRKHTKQVVVVKWSGDGGLLCTLSHDKQVILYKRSVHTGLMELYQTILCTTTPESAAFVPVAAIRPIEEDSSADQRHDHNDTDVASASAPVDEAENMDDFVSQLLQKNQRGAAVPPPSGVATASTTGSVVGDAANQQSSIQIRPADTASGIGLVTDSTAVYSANSGTTITNSSSTVQYELVLGMRDVPYLTYIHCGTLQTRNVSLNEHAWDTHVSFTPLYLAPSPTGDRLLVATDKHMHIVLRTGTNERLQILSGHSCGDYGKPVVQWDMRGEYVYCNSDDDNTVKVFSLTTCKIVKSLAGHGKGIVRSLCTHKDKPLMVSASYDKSVIVWGVK